MDNDKQLFLITGSSGFLGQALVQHFDAKNNVVIGFDKESHPHPIKHIECLFCDLSSDESMQKTFALLRAREGNKIAAVFHLAAYYSFSGEDSPLYTEITVKGTERMLRELQDFQVGQFIFSSSMLVHKPNQPGEKINEESPIDPTWQYPKSKVETEKLIHEKHGNIPVVILRIAGVYNDDCHSIPIAHQIQRIYEGQLEGHLYSGNTDVRQSFLHINDLVKAFECVVAHAADLPSESVFEIGEGDAMSYEEMQKQIGMLTHGQDWKTFSVPKPIAKAAAFVEGEIPFVEKPFVKPWMVDHADDNYEVNIDKARRILGWQPENHLHDVIPKMIECLKSDPLNWYKINNLQAPTWVKNQDAAHLASSTSSASS